MIRYSSDKLPTWVTFLNYMYLLLTLAKFFLTDCWHSMFLPETVQDKVVGLKRFTFDIVDNNNSQIFTQSFMALGTLLRACLKETDNWSFILPMGEDITYM